MAVQIQSLNGSVKESKTNNPVGFANLFIARTGEGCSSKGNGSFQMNLVFSKDSDTIKVSHVNYETFYLTVAQLKEKKLILLENRLIPFETVTVTGQADHQTVNKDLPQTISVLKASAFEMTGYSDAADLLSTDNSVQVQETLSGKKEISMRGGNPDDVVILFNGIRMNTSFDDQADLSLFDIQDLEKIELVKGSNTVIYGPDAFSGVINFVPKDLRDYSVRFRQEFGPYDSGKWGIHFHHSTAPAFGSVSYQAGAMNRPIITGQNQITSLINSKDAQFATIGLNIEELKEWDSEGHIKLNIFRQHTYFNNQKENEVARENTRVFDAAWKKETGFLGPFDVRVFIRSFNSDISLRQPIHTWERVLSDKTTGSSVSHTLTFLKSTLMLTGSAEKSEVLVSEKNLLPGLERRGDYQLDRIHGGLAAIFKHSLVVTSNSNEEAELSLSARYDRLQDNIDPGQLNGNDTKKEARKRKNWEGAVVKFSTSIKGELSPANYFLFLNFGKNIKFPGLSNQIMQPLVQSGKNTELTAEKNESFDFGIKLVRDYKGHPIYSGWELTSNLFRNWYKDKLREIVDPISPVVYYDNIQTASIQGAETEVAIRLFEKKITVSGGANYYSITEKMAFPFKSASQGSLNFAAEHAGYSFYLHWFYEGEQSGWVRGNENQLKEIVLPSYSNLDLHLTKTVQFWQTRCMLSGSWRNIMKSDYNYQGLILRDRRIYIIFGIQY